MNTQRHTNIPASYLFLIRDNEILLLRRYNTGYEDGNYSVIAGHVDKGESFTEAIIREAKEEANITLKKDDLKVVHIMHRNSKTTKNNERIDTFFVAENWSGELKNVEPNKCDDLSWFEIDKLPQNIIPYIKQAIEESLDNNFYSEHGWK